tara:strand:+ start:525 stop:827 length:303 start_codon:yes stop_codon:yes gene_type:complete
MQEKKKNIDFIKKRLDKDLLRRGVIEDIKSKNYLTKYSNSIGKDNNNSDLKITKLKIEEKSKNNKPLVRSSNNKSIVFAKNTCLKTIRVRTLYEGETTES